MHSYVNDYRQSFSTIDEMLQSLPVPDSIKAICLGNISVEKKEKWWFSAIFIVIGIAIGLFTNLPSIVISLIPLIIIAPFGIYGLIRLAAKKKRLVAQPLIITNEYIFIFDLVIYDKKSKRYSYKELYRLDRKNVKEYFSILDYIPEVGSTVKTVTSVVSDAIERGVTGQIELRLDIKNKGTITLNSEFCSKKGYENLISSGKVISLNEAAKLYFS